MSISRFMSLSVFVIIAAGCDANLSPTEKAKKDPLVQALSRVGQMYHNYHDVHAIGPANWDELKSVAGGDQENLDAIQTVRDNGYDLQWGVRLRDVTGGTSNTVMGQSSQASPQLMFDGSVRI